MIEPVEPNRVVLGFRALFVIAASAWLFLNQHGTTGRADPKEQPKQVAEAFLEASQQHIRDCHGQDSNRCFIFNPKVRVMITTTELAFYKLNVSVMRVEEDGAPLRLHNSFDGNNISGTFELFSDAFLALMILWWW